MNKESEALKRIRDDFEAFCEAIDRCRTSDGIGPETFKDAYASAARVRERYLKEREHLTRPVIGDLDNVFCDGYFTKGMMQMRNVAEHVKLERPFQIVIRLGSPFQIDSHQYKPIELSADSSALTLFPGRWVDLKDTSGNQHQMDHLKQLDELKRRISKALCPHR